METLKIPKGPWKHGIMKPSMLNGQSPADIKALYRSASILRNNRVVFNIAGNKYRLIVRINYDSKTVFVRFIGTHREYDKIDAEVI